MRVLTLLLTLCFLVPAAAGAQDATPEPTADATAVPTLARQGTAEPTADAAPEPTADATATELEGFQGPGGYSVVLTVDGRQRVINLLVPESYRDGEPVPLVLVLHGAGGDGRSVAAVTGFGALAEAERFVVAFPDGIGGGWNDGRPDPRLVAIDDVGFLASTIDFLSQQLAIDRRRVYIAGFSMGGMLAFRAGCLLGDRVAAIATVATTMPAYSLDACVFADPIPVLVIQGSQDSMSPGMRDPYGNRVMFSIEETLRYWSEKSRCEGAPVIVDLPDALPDDGTTIREWTASGCLDGAGVTAYLVGGGGHTWPGHPFQTSLDLGRTSRELDATQAVWDFFADQAMPATDVATPEPTAEVTP